jgi:hypothetical protein
LDAANCRVDAVVGKFPEVKDADCRPETLSTGKDLKKWLRKGKAYSIGSFVNIT